jgi:hypothetical protein
VTVPGTESSARLKSVVECASTRAWRVFLHSRLAVYVESANTRAERVSLHSRWSAVERSGPAVGLDDSARTSKAMMSYRAATVPAAMSCVWV